MGGRMKRIIIVAVSVGLFALAFAQPASASSLRGESRARVPLVSCSTPLRLYDGTYLSGTSVSIYTRGAWINLSSYGFDNRTSSFQVGACSVSLAAGSGGGGLHYSECLYAGCVENVVASGWNNVISSVYVH